MIFNRRICFALLVLLAIAVNPTICFSGGIFNTPVPPKVCEQVEKIYQEASEKMKLCSPVYAAAPHPKSGLQVNYSLPTDLPKEIEVYDPKGLCLCVRASSLRVLCVGNCLVGSTKEPPSGWQKIPTLTREAAIERAKGYLKVFNMDVPPDYKLTVTNFGDDGGPGCWRVLWRRFSGPYPWDDASLQWECVFVDFYEKEGLSTVSAHGCNCSAPRSLKVRISKEEAIAKAIRYMTRPWYDRRWRVEAKGVVKSVVSCELMVSAPRAGARAEREVMEAMSEGQAPRETRLCWKTDLTVGTLWDYKGKKPQTEDRAYEYLVLIDAETGAVMRWDPPGVW